MHEPDLNFPTGLFLPHTGSTPEKALTPRRVAVCKHCRLLFAGEINEFGEAKPTGICPKAT